MKRIRTAGVLAGLALLAVAAPAQAAPVTVDLRIEGARTTLFEAPVTTDVRTVDGSDGTGAHPCDAGKGAATAGTAVADAADEAPFTWKGAWSASFGDFLASEFLGETPAGSGFWGFYVNGAFASAGMCSTAVSAGDEVLFAISADGTEKLLALSGPDRAKLGKVVKLKVTDAGSGKAVRGAAVAGKVTGADGTVRLAVGKRGPRSFKATMKGAIRSAEHVICVTDGRADGFCGSRDRLVPKISVLGIEGGAVFARKAAPRELGGTVTDPSGVRAVKLSLERRTGSRCEAFSGRDERFKRAACDGAKPFRVGRSADWSYLLPKRLGKGSYVLEVHAEDKAGNGAAKRVRFRVR